MGQVISGKRYWSDETPVAGQQFEYGFDDIGNRKMARRGGDENGWKLRESLYGVNVLNQYTNRTVPGFADVVVGCTGDQAGVCEWTDGVSGRADTSAGN